jgi:protein-S-isoprenylcysteine O-methyltransferase Ste14
MKTALKIVASVLYAVVLYGTLLFLPAGTFNYWQAWVYIGIVTVATLVPSAYLSRTNPAALKRRMRAGPRAEGRTAQKFIITAAFLGVFAMMAFSAFDHRMGWSSVPTWVSLVGDVLVATGLGVAMLVVVQNGYAAATVTVEADQPLVSGGLYKFVRHPMYVGNVIMMVGLPLALGSYWGLLLVIPSVLVLVFRILDEEKMLTQELRGYRQYRQRVRYRLAPYVW